MFDIGWNELLVIALVAIVVIGPKDLPRVMRSVGRWIAKLKRMGSEFQGQFNEALREAELDDVRQGIEDLRNINPLTNLRDEVTKVGEDIKKGMDVSTASAAATPADATPAESAPAEPASVEPAPAEPSSVEPAPLEPVPLEPVPLEPVPLEPASVEPEPLTEMPVPAPAAEPAKPVEAVTPEPATAAAASEVKP